MNINFESITERDMDFLIMRQLQSNRLLVSNLFLKPMGLQDDYELSSISHSVMTTDGESDIQAVLTVGDKKIGLLIEDKVDATAQSEQAARYILRGDKAVRNGEFESYHVFIVAPQKYLDGDSEAQKYPNKVSYEQLRAEIRDGFDMAIIDKALDESKHGYVPIKDEKVTDFWNKLYDFVDLKYPGVFSLQGEKGASRGSNAYWIPINSGSGTWIQIKSDRGYVDLEIRGYTSKFQEFSKANQALLDERRLYLRMAGKSLAIRSYIEPFDFKKPFEDQAELVDQALYQAQKLQGLVKDLKL